MNGSRICSFCWKLFCVLIYLFPSTSWGQDKSEPDIVEIFIKYEKLDSSFVHKKKRELVKPLKPVVPIKRVAQVERGNYALLDLHFICMDSLRVGFDLIELEFDITEKGAIKALKVFRSTNANLRKYVLRELFRTKWSPALNQNNKRVRSTVKKHWIYLPRTWDYN